jgi:hypothetical protein
MPEKVVFRQKHFGPNNKHTALEILYERSLLEDKEGLKIAKLFQYTRECLKNVLLMLNLYIAMRLDGHQRRHSGNSVRQNSVKKA